MKKKILLILAVLSTALSLEPLLRLPTWGLFLISIGIGIVLFGWLWVEIHIPKDTTLDVVENFTVPPKHLVLAYGSLLIKESLLRTIPCENCYSLKPARSCRVECMPAELQGYRRSWIRTGRRIDLLDERGKPLSVSCEWAAISIEKGDRTESVPGAVIGLTDEALFAR